MPDVAANAFRLNPRCDGAFLIRIVLPYRNRPSCLNPRFDGAFLIRIQEVKEAGDEVLIPDLMGLF